MEIEDGKEPKQIEFYLKKMRFACGEAGGILEDEK